MYCSQQPFYFKRDRTTVIPPPPKKKKKKYVALQRSLQEMLTEIETRFLLHKTYPIADDLILL